MKVMIVQNTSLPHYKYNYNKPSLKNNTFIKPIQNKLSPENIQAYYLSPTFGYKSVLKTEWLKGNMPSVKIGIYGGKLTKKNVTLEHIIPHSKGGKTEIANLALAVDVNNFTRSNKPLKEVFDPTTFYEYLEQFKEVDLPDFKGLIYIDKIIKVVKRVLKNEGVDISQIPYFNK